MIRGFEPPGRKDTGLHELFPVLPDIFVDPTNEPSILCASLCHCALVVQKILSFSFLMSIMQ